MQPGGGECDAGIESEERLRPERHRSACGSVADRGISSDVALSEARAGSGPHPRRAGARVAGHPAEAPGRGRTGAGAPPGLAMDRAGADGSCVRPGCPGGRVLMLPEPLLVVTRLARAFDDLAVRYVVGGSLASSLHGVPRATQDVDLVAEIGLEHVEALERALADEFYLDAVMIRDAIRRRASFNVVHLQTMFK